MRAPTPPAQHFPKVNGFLVAMLWPNFYTQYCSLDIRLAKRLLPDYDSINVEGAPI